MTPATRKIADLPAVTSLTGAEQLIVVQDGATKRTTAADVALRVAVLSVNGEGDAVTMAVDDMADVNAPSVPNGRTIIWDSSSSTFVVG